MMVTARGFIAVIRIMFRIEPAIGGIKSEVDVIKRNIFMTIPIRELLPDQ
ncbi:MAG TPA: hypothetical protein PK874_11725 [Desulfobacteraceae bacterium]|nr:hypothetical protein [Desulfobacteraceae bacterium]HPJ67089.1 hypothetical protein [Desulfobacteraceae bacterium]HPQ29215.1 hypothetical protein [Desulfobacteraceae bacterium]